jgi:hypothetical protein
MSDFSVWLDQEMEERGVALRDVADGVGVAWSTVRSWRKGWTKPGFEYTEAIARVMNADVARVRVMLGYGDVGEEPATPSEVVELGSIYLELEPERQESLLLVARSLRDSQRRRGRGQ